MFYLSSVNDWKYNVIRFYEFQQKIFDDKQNNIRPYYVDGGPGCFGDSGGPLWRQVTDEKTKTVVPVLVGVFSYLLWGTCHGAQEPKYYGQVASIKDWINQYVPIEQTCEYSTFLSDHSKNQNCIQSILSSSIIYDLSTTDFFCLFC